MPTSGRPFGIPLVFWFSFKGRFWFCVWSCCSTPSVAVPTSGRHALSRFFLDLAVLLLKAVSTTGARTALGLHLLASPLAVARGFNGISAAAAIRSLPSLIV